MGRKAGGKNYGNIAEEAAHGVELPQTERDKLPIIFTKIDKDFISISDLMDVSGLSYDSCSRIMRQIKAVSDIFGISGHVHRTDYYVYVARQFSAGVKEVTV